MNWLSAATRPFVWLLGASTDAALRLLGIRGGPSRSVTEEEIAAWKEACAEVVKGMQENNDRD